MILNAKCSTILLSSLLSFAVNAQTTQPEGTKRQLTFEKSEKKVNFYTGPVWGQGPVIPDYAAIMELEVEGYFPASRCVGMGGRFERIIKSSVICYPLGISDLQDNDEWGRKVKETSVWSLMSKKQRHYIQTSGTGGFRGDFGIRTIEKDKNKYGVYKVILFAVSEKDARLMAIALVECLNSLHNENLIKSQKELEKYAHLMQEEKNQIAKLEVDLKKMRAEASTLQATVHYTNPESVFIEFVEMDKLVRVIGIDIAGARARMDAIKEIEKKSGERNQLLLDQKRIELNIEMAGLLARKKATTDARDQAKIYFNLLKQVETNESTIQADSVKYKGYRENVLILKDTLGKLPANMKPVIVVDNKVVIHPVSRQP